MATFEDKPERVLRDEIVAYLRRRGYRVKSEMRMNDPEVKTFWVQPDIVLEHGGLTWFIEVKKDTLMGAMGLGQALTYVTFAAHHGYDPKRVRAVLVVEKNGLWPTEAFVDACERAGVEVWRWHGHRLTKLGTPVAHPLAPRHPLRTTAVRHAAA